MIAYFKTINYVSLYGSGYRGEILEHSIYSNLDDIYTFLNSEGVYMWTNPTSGTDTIYIDLDKNYNPNYFYDTITQKIREIKIDMILEN
jgi:hypothetical protein